MHQTEYSASYALLRVGDLHALWIFKRYGCDALASAMKAQNFRSTGWLQYSDSPGTGFALSEKMHGKGARDPLEQHPSFPETLIICRVNRYVL